MKDFIVRAVIFAIINFVLMGTFFLFNRNAAMPDYNIVYGTLVSMVLGFPFEFASAKKRGVRPDVAGGVGAAWFGAILMAAIVFVVLLSTGIIK